jgi:hypothetical protein
MSTAQNDISEMLNDDYTVSSVKARDLVHDWLDADFWTPLSIVDFYNMYDGCFFE